MAKSIITAIVAVSLMAITAMATPTIVVDGDERYPVSNVAVFDSKGHNIGSTDDNGQIPQASPSSYPLSLRHMCYTPASVEYGIDTIALETMIYDIPEVSVSTSMDNILLTMYVRQYTHAYDESGKLTDTIDVFYEGISKFLLPLDKLETDIPSRMVTGRGYRRLRTRDKSTGEMRDSFGMTFNRQGFFSAIIGLDSRPAVMQKSRLKTINLNSSHDVIEGEYGICAEWRRDASLASIQYDGLADKKDHHYSPWVMKLLGLTVDATEMVWNETYRTRNENDYSMRDLLSISGLFTATFKGKVFKKFLKQELTARMYVEMYVVDYEYLSKEEGKIWKKSEIADSTVEIIPPAFAPALSQATQQIKEAAIAAHAAATAGGNGDSQDDKKEENSLISFF